MSIKPVESKSLVEAAIEEIIYQIEQGYLKVGDKLDSQRVLAKKLNVGMGCIREAIQSLSLARIVDVKPGKGVYVADISIRSLINPTKIITHNSGKNKKELVDLLEARMLMETGSVKYIINNIKEENISEIENILKEMSDFIKAKRFDLIHQHDMKFHNTLIKNTNNQVIISMYDFINKLLPEVLELKKDKTIYAERGLKEHSDILKAVKNKDEKKADILIKEHLNNSAMDIIKTFKENASDQE